MTSLVKSALIIVDFQEDFCPPNGALAVEGGRDIADTINSLMEMPGIALRIATKDWHPRNHISFASNHSAPNNKPFESIFTIANPENPEEKEETRLWPVHCVQDTKGAELIPELNTSKVDHIIEKGQDSRVEMYSAFKAPFDNPRIAESGLAKLLRDENITHVYCVGLALDYCVRCTAVDAAKEGFETFIIKEACRPVDQAVPNTAEFKKQLVDKGVKLVSIDDDVVKRLRS